MGAYSLSPPLLAAAQSGSREAAGEIIEANTGLVHAIVRRFAGRGADSEELFQVGLVGLYKAVCDFDLSYGVAFSTYAVPKIEGEIRRFLRSDGMVRISRTVYERAGMVRRAQADMTARLGRPVRISELADALGLTPEEIAETELAFAGVDSLEREIGDDGTPLGELLADDAAREHTTDAILLRDAVSRLPPKERSVIEYLFYRGLTQMQTAAVLHISQVQVSRLRRRALDELRAALSDE